MSIINISNARILEFTICLNKLQHLNESILCNLCLKENDLINRKLQSSILCVLVPQNGRYQLAIDQRSPKSASKIFEWRKNVECQSDSTCSRYSSCQKHLCPYNSSDPQNIPESHCRKSYFCNITQRRTYSKGTYFRSKEDARTKTSSKVRNWTLSLV